MKATIFHKTFEFNVPQDVALKYLTACEILDKEEAAIKESEPYFNNTNDELFPLIALTAIVKQASNIDDAHISEDIHTITIKLPSFNNISSMLDVKIKTNSYNESLLRNVADKIMLYCEMAKASFEQEDADIYRMAVLNVLTEQINRK